MNGVWPLLLLFASSTIGGPALAQGYPPEEAVARMKVSDGFQVSLFASEPEVRQPIFAKCDTRGRLWVIQYLQYPNPAGLKRIKVDRYSRTTYDRIPEPPPRGPKGADRITILEDRDGDGRADTFKDFISDLNLCTGVAFGYGGVFVLQVPYLLFYPDRNRDDIPDSDPEVLLEGFGMEDSQSLANHLTWGPDGWLYGLNGSTTTCRIRGLTFQQGVWRYHPRTKEFELFAEGGGNVYGLTFDRNGNLFYSSNGAHLFWHAVQGGYYEKSFGKHGPLTNPHTYGYFPSVKHTAFTGGHVVTGGTIYLGDSFPQLFRGSFIAGNLLSHYSAWWTVRPSGSTFEAKQEGILLDSRDTWFAPTDMALGPDGAMYVTDFYDARTAHPDPDAEWDRSNGRVYKIQAHNAKRMPQPDMERLSSRELVELLVHKNGWFANEARVLLAARRDASVLPELRRMALQAEEANAALQALWALHASGGFDDRIAAQLLDRPFEYVRAWTVRLLGDQRQVAPDIARQLVRLARSDPSVVVRSQLAATAKRLPARDGLPIVAGVLAQDRDMTDPHVPLLAWWAIEDKAVSDPRLLLAKFGHADAWTSAMTRDQLRRLARRWIAEGSLRTDEACMELLSKAPAEQLPQMLSWLDQGLAERISGPTVFRDTSVLTQFAKPQERKPSPRVKAAPLPAPLKQRIHALWRESQADPLRLRLAVRAGIGAAYDQAIATAVDRGSPEHRRIDALGVLAEIGREDAVPKVLPLLREDETESVRAAAIDVLARFEKPEIPAALVKAYSTMPPGLKARARAALLSRPSSAFALLLEIDNGRLPAAEISPNELRLIVTFEDSSLNALVRKHWGSVGQGTPEEKLAEVRRLSNDLRAGRGDVKSGRRLFLRHCGGCHKLFGEGGNLGMDLTPASRADTMYLLTHIADPGVFIRKEYMSVSIRTKGGRALSGLIAEQDVSGITLIDASLQRTRVPRSDIVTMGESEISLMPEGLLSGWRPQEVRDLFAFLQMQ
jgi:putative membrane-bound dehydrogenase-like protein